MGQVAIKCWVPEHEFFTSAVHTIFLLCTLNTIIILVAGHKKKFVLYRKVRHN